MNPTFEKIEEYTPQSSTRDLLDDVEAVVDEYVEKEDSLTLRQLFYQLESRGALEKTEDEYERLSYAVKRARRGGLLPWNVIVDRERVPFSNTHYGGPAHRLRSAARSHRLDLWEGQDVRPEVWIEKVALVEVLSDVCRDLDVLYFGCKGNLSASALWDAVKRHRKHEENGQRVEVLHFADMDPSGVTMTETLRRKFGEFGTDTIVERVALTFGQAQKLDATPGTVKEKDAKADAYVERFGTEKTWEIDALTPDEIRGLIRGAVTDLRDDDLWNEREELQDEQREKLHEVAHEFD